MKLRSSGAVAGRFVRAGLVAAALLLSASASARGVTVTEVPTPVKGGMPLSIAVTQDGAVWYGAGADGVGIGRGQPHIGRVHPRTMQVRIFPLGRGATAPRDLVQAGNGRVWGIVDGGGSPGLVTVDPATGVVRRVPVHPGDALDRLVAAPSGRLFGIAARSGAGEPDDLVEVDAATGARRLIRRSTPVQVQGATGPFTSYTRFTALAASGSAVWLAEEEYSGLSQRVWVTRVDPVSGASIRHELGVFTKGLTWLTASDADEAWAMRPTPERNDAQRFTAATGAVSTLRIPIDLTHLTMAGGALWAISGRSIAQVNQSSGALTLTTPLTPASGMLDLVVAPDGAVWSRQRNADNLVRVSLDRGVSTANARSAIADGLVAPVRCSSACTGSVRVTLGRQRNSASAARRSAGRVLGVTRFRLSRGGQKAARVRLARRAEALLRTRRIWRTTIQTRIRAGQRTRTTRRHIALRFYRRPRLAR